MDLLSCTGAFLSSLTYKEDFRDWLLHSHLRLALNPLPLSSNAVHAYLLSLRPFLSKWDSGHCVLVRLLPVICVLRLHCVVSWRIPLLWFALLPTGKVLVMCLLGLLMATSYVGILTASARKEGRNSVRSTRVLFMSLCLRAFPASSEWKALPGITRLGSIMFKPCLWWRCSEPSFPFPLN
jgi:hypothetical protein